MPRKRHYRRNPIGAVAVKQWTQGVDMMDAAAAVGGFAAASLIPPMLVKTVDTTTQKLLKVVVAAVSAIGAGYVGRSFVSTSAGKAALIGGLAIAGANVLAMAGVQIGEPRRRMLPTGGTRQVGIPQTVSPPVTREGETVSILMP